MPISDKIVLEAQGKHPFKFWIEKAVPSEENQNLIIEGIASTTNVDHDKERMSADAIKAMATIINQEGVPLRVEHQKDALAVIGKVDKAWIDERNQLHVRATLDKDHPVSPVLHHSMKSGTKMGLSVGGIVKRAVKEFVDSVGGLVKTFYDVELQEVSVTPRPSNFDSWLMAKSIAKSQADAERFSDNQALRREFLTENSQLDYLASFAKSIPDEAWRQVESPININKDVNNMDETKKTNSEETDETKKTVSRAELTVVTKAVAQLSELMTKGFESIAGILQMKKMEVGAHDQNNPDKEKPKDESSTAKAAEVGAHDQNNPDKEKPADESPAAKTADDTDMTSTDKKKSATETEDETKKTKDDATYTLETTKSAVNKLEQIRSNLNKAESTDTDETKKTSDKKDETDTTKASETDTTDETKKNTDTDETTKTVHPLDLFIATVTKAIEDIAAKIEKGGHRVLGLEKEMVMKHIVNDPQVQEEIQKMMKIPGQKKSLVMGVPHMVTKDGRRIALIPGAETVEKSAAKEHKTFNELYKAEYSSVSEQDANE